MRRRGPGGAEAGPVAVTTTFGTGSEGAGANGTDGATVGMAQNDEIAREYQHLMQTHTAEGEA